ncbi:MAG: phosphoglycolate phosphatase [Coxiella sp. (in: Bacteria)]|nr:MAG: phosphoglycolate phosphatase [Coxiella sp. (in: g-proteobacteria)]
MLTTSIKAVLFDLDGTLLDTARDLYPAMRHALQTYRQPTLSFETFLPTITLGTHHMICNAFNIASTDTQFEAIKQCFLTYYADHLATHTPYFPGIEALLHTLDKNNLPWGIVTNKPAQFSLPIIKARHLDQRARCIISGDTLTLRKPHPAPLLHACDLLQIAPENTVYIGDAKTDIDAANAANMPSIAVTYGYRDSADDPQTWQAHHVVEHPDAISTLLTTFEEEHAQ